MYMISVYLIAVSMTSVYMTALYVSGMSAYIRHYVLDLIFKAEIKMFLLFMTFFPAVYRTSVHSVYNCMYMTAGFFYIE